MPSSSSATSGHRPAASFKTSSHADDRSSSPSMTSTMKIRDELLTCRMCSLKFRLFGKRPLALRCMHTFCEECLVGLASASSSSSKIQVNRRTAQQLACPMCQQPTPIGKEKDACRQLPVNPSIMELLQILDKASAVGGSGADAESLPVSSNGWLGQAVELHGTTVFAHSSSDFGQNGGATTVSTGLTRAQEPAHVKRRAPDVPKPSTNGAAYASSVDYCRQTEAETENLKEMINSSANLVTTVSVGNSAAAAKPWTHQSAVTPHQLHQQSHSGHNNVIPASTNKAGSSTRIIVAPNSSVHYSSQNPDADSNAVPPPSLTSHAAASQLCSQCGKASARVTVANASKMTSERLCNVCAQSRLVHAPADNGRSNGRITTSMESKLEQKTADANAASSSQMTSLVDTVPSASSHILIRNTRTTFGAANAQFNRHSEFLPTQQPEPLNLVNSNPPNPNVHRRTGDNDDAVHGCTDQLSAVRLHISDTSVAATSFSSGGNSSNSSVQTDHNATEAGSSTEQSADDDDMVDRIREKASHETTHGNQFQIFPNAVQNGVNAPLLSDFHPEVCDNPPYNPAYLPGNTWQRPPGGRNAYPMSPPPPFNETAPVPFDGGQRAQYMQQSFYSRDSQGMPAEPPKYDDVVAGNALPCAPPMQPQSGLAALRAAGYDVNVDGWRGNSIRLLKAFGRYGELSTQPGAFRAPSRISVSVGDVNDTMVRGARNGQRVTVADRANSTVQVFSMTGECLSMLHIDAVNGCCLWPDNRRLVAATDRGVEIYNINGVRLDNVPLGVVLNTVWYRSGFIAVQSKSISLFTGPNASLSRTLTTKAKPGQYHHLVPFEDVRDVAVNSQQDLIVLEMAAGSGQISVMNDDGYVKSTIAPLQSDPCGPLRSPMAVAVDFNHNIVVADGGFPPGSSGGKAGNDNGVRSGRVIQFGANGRFQRIIVNGDQGSADSQTAGVRGGSDEGREVLAEAAGRWPAGVAVGTERQLFVVMRGDKYAEVRVYSYV